MYRALFVVAPHAKITTKTKCLTDGWCAARRGNVAIKNKRIELHKIKVVLRAGSYVVSQTRYFSYMYERDGQTRSWCCILLSSIKCESDGLLGRKATYWALNEITSSRQCVNIFEFK